MFAQRVQSNYCLSPAEVDSPVEGAAASQCTVLDTVAPLRRKTVNQTRFAPWYNLQIRTLKQKAQRLETKRHSSSLEGCHLACRARLIA